MYEVIITGAVSIICVALPIWAKYRENQRKELDKKIDTRFDKIEQVLETISNSNTQSSALLIDVARSTFVSDCDYNIKRGYRTGKSTDRILKMYQDYNDLLDTIGIENGYIDDVHKRFLDLEVRL